MSLQFPNQVLLADGVQVRRYTSLPPTPALAAGVTPYIPYTETPRFTWVCQGVEGAGPIYFKVEITWLGNGAIVPVKEISVDGITTQNFTVGYFQRLKYTLAQDAGGEYEVLLTATQNGVTARMGGRFRINFRPTAPLNLQVI